MPLINRILSLTQDCSALFASHSYENYMCAILLIQSLRSPTYTFASKTISKSIFLLLFPLYLSQDITI